MGKEATTPTGISELAGKFVKGNVIDRDFEDIKGIIPETHKIMTPKEWQKRKQRILKRKLP